MAKIQHGDQVEVTTVLPDDLHRFPFIGAVEAIAYDIPDGTEYTTVKDQEGNRFNINTDRLELVD